MPAEVIEYFREMFEKNLPVDGFIDSDWTMANARLCDFYGLPEPKAGGFQRVSLKPEDHRGGLLTVGAQFSRSLKPLEKHRQIITPISGLHHPGGLGQAHNGINVWLTGGKLGPSDRNTISVDQKMAEVTAQHTRISSMEVAITQDSLAWTADGVRLPPMRRCSEIFASMFAEPKGGIAAQRRALRRKASVLDHNRAEVRRLEQKMNAADKGRMEQYLTSVRGAEIRTRQADAWLDTPLPAVSDADRARTNRDIPESKAGDYFRTVYDLMVLAFQTDVTRVATFRLGGEGQAIAIPEIGITESRHQLSHHGGDPG